MSEELVIRLCAPTLAGIKTGSLFSAEYDSEESFRRELRALNHMLVPKGLRALTLRYGIRRALVYVYRPALLQRDLREGDANRLLQELGYDVSSPEGCIRQLARRVKKSKEFPHEIGLFLSYPPEDVRGFMEHRAEGCKCVGCWKVYGDAEKAKQVFRRYKHCTEVYCRRWRSGATMDRLTVAGSFFQKG